MAELILTQEETAASSWLDLSDEALGRMCRAWVARWECDSSVEEHERVAAMAAALAFLVGSNRRKAVRCVLIRMPALCS